MAKKAEGERETLPRCAVHNLTLLDEERADGSVAPSALCALCHSLEVANVVRALYRRKPNAVDPNWLTGW